MPSPSPLLQPRLKLPSGLRDCIATELTQRAAGLEAEAVYSDAKAAHEQRVQDINGVIEELQLDVQRASSDINSA